MPHPPFSTISDRLPALWPLDAMAWWCHASADCWNPPAKPDSYAVPGEPHDLPIPEPIEDDGEHGLFA